MSTGGQFVVSPDSGDGSGFRLAGRVFEAVDIHVAETIAALARDRESGGG
jgi:hypothetical protein